jgi:uncharacterized protein YndB with AHSA1/START domain
MRGSVEVAVAASPERVFGLISDITRMGDWSPETIRGEWVPPYDAPAVGARFRGTNRSPNGREWTTECEITECEPGRSFVFRVQLAGGQGSEWGYRISPDGNGCRVEEFFSNERADSFLRRTVQKLAMGIADRQAHNEQGMRETLSRIKAAAESA